MKRWLALGVLSCTATPETEEREVPLVSRPELFDYAMRCAEALGRVEPWSCLDGVIIPITLNGVEVAAGETVDECDRPAWLVEDACVPGTRVGTLVARNADGSARNDADWVYICRRLSPRAEDDPVFENVAVIGHDRTSGATCFFQGPDGVATDTSRIPPPFEDPRDTPVGAARSDDFWALTEATVLQSPVCTICHDSSPWIHSPFVDQRDIVPVSSLTTPYYDLFSGAAPPSIAPPGNPCVSCHRIGTGASCSTYLDYTTGASSPARTSQRGRDYPRSHTMPPEAPATTGAWHDQNAAAVAKLRACCASESRDPECGHSP